MGVQNRIDRDEVFAQMLAEMRHQRMSNTSVVQLLRSGTTNDVLLTELVQLDANGYAQRAFPTPMGSVAVANHSATTQMIVAGTSVGGAPPSSGVGLFKVPASTAALVNIASHVLSLFGEPGGQVSIQVFAKAQPPAFGAGVGPVVGTSAVRTTTITRFASAGPAGVTAPGTYNIVAGRKSFTVMVNGAATIATPTLNGVALPVGQVATFSADQGRDTLAAAVLITVAGDDVTLLELA